MPHSQPTALQQTVCKFHLDPQYHIFHWGSTILGDSTLCVASGEAELSSCLPGLELVDYFGIQLSPKYIAKPTGTDLRFNQIWGPITSTMLFSTMNQVLSCILTVEKCVFSEDIGVHESLIFGNTPWKLHTRVVCIGGWQWQHSANDQTLNSSEPQICTGGFSTVIWLRLDAKIVDKHKAWQTAA